MCKDRHRKQSCWTSSTLKKNYSIHTKKVELKGFMKKFIIVLVLIELIQKMKQAIYASHMPSKDNNV